MDSENERARAPGIWSELLRRRVVRVLIAYAAGAFVLLQAADLILPALDAPQRLFRLLVIAAIAGAPIAAMLSWVFDFNNGRIIRDANTTHISKRIAIAGAATVVAVIAGWYAIERPYRAVDDNLIAIIPFRVTGTNPSLQSFGEGMTDLLAMKLQAGAVRAVDPTSLLAAFRRQQKAGAAEDGLKDFARSMGAGRLLTGTVVGAGNHVVLSGVLQPIGVGKKVTYTVEGPADSVTWLADRLALGLLSLDAGESEAHLADLTSASMPALIDYLHGLSAYRKGSFGEAVTSFISAVQQDSTFGLAGLAVEKTWGWFVPPATPRTAAQRALAKRAAIRGRDHFDAVDRAIFTALFGLDPENREGSAAERCAAWSEALTLAPGRADILHWVGDCSFHFGRAFGATDWRETARQYFERSIRIDSTMTPSLFHLLQLAVSANDSAGSAKWGQLALASSGNERRFWVEWLTALGTRNKAEIKRLSAQLSLETTPVLLYQFHLDNRIATPYMDTIASLAISVGRNNPGPTDWMSEHVWQMWGRLDAIVDNARAPDDKQVAARAMLLSMYGELDTAAARPVIDRVLANASRVRPEKATERSEYYNTICLAAQWKLWHRDTSEVDHVIQRLDSVATARGDTPGSVDGARLCIALLRAIRATVTNAPDARRLILAADSLNSMVFRATTISRYMRFPIARMLELNGDAHGALRALDELSYGLEREWIIPMHLREGARLSAILGDKQRALTDYKFYLDLRTHEDAAGAAASAPARAAFARLMSENGR